MIAADTLGRAPSAQITQHKIFKLIVIAATLIATSLVGQVLRFEFSHIGVHYFAILFDVDGEYNVPALYSGFLLIVCSINLARCSRRARAIAQPHYRFWSFLSIAFVYLAIDEVLGLHELTVVPLRERFNFSGIFWFAWVTVALPIVVVVAASSIPFLRVLPKRTRAFFLGAGTIYTGGVLGMEMFAAHHVFTHGSRSLQYSLIATIE